jgi:hypothetical protein
MSLLAELLILAAGVSLLSIAVYAAAPVVLAWRRSREARPLGVFNVSDAFPLLRQDLEAVAAPVAPAPAAPPKPVAGPAGLISEVELLHQEVDVLRQELGSLKTERRRRLRPLQPAADLPAALKRELLAIRHLRSNHAVLVALPGLPRRIA